MAGLLHSIRPAGSRGATRTSRYRILQAAGATDINKVSSFFLSFPSPCLPLGFSSICPYGTGGLRGGAGGGQSLFQWRKRYKAVDISVCYKCITTLCVTISPLPPKHPESTIWDEYCVEWKHSCKRCKVDGSKSRGTPL